MKHILFSLVFGCILATPSFASPIDIQIGSLPKIDHETPALIASLEVLRARIKQDAQECSGDAEGMDATGAYDATLKKIVETSRAVVIEVAGTKICDGIHTSSYRYAIALDAEHGKRIDLAGIYNIGTRNNGHVFLRHELINVVKKRYAEANVKNASCMKDAGCWRH